MVLPGSAAGEGSNAGDHAAVVLEVVVGIQNVVLPFVLVLGRHRDCGEPALELGHSVDAVIGAPVGEGSPGLVGTRQVVHVLPVPGVDERQDAGTVCTGPAAEDPVQGRAPCGRLAQAAPQLAFALLPVVLGDEVDLVGLVQQSDRLDRPVHQVHEVGEGVTEETGDPEHDVDPRTPELVLGNDLDAAHAPVLGVPDRAHAEEVQGLGDVIAVCAHRGCAPDHDAYRLWIGTLLVKVALEEGLGELAADLIGDR